MTGIAWIATAEAAALILIAAVLAVRGWRGAKRHYAAVAALAELPPPLTRPEQVKALSRVLADVPHASEYGGRMDEFASAALEWVDQRQRGELETLRQAGYRTWGRREQRREGP